MSRRLELKEQQLVDTMAWVEDDNNNDNDNNDDNDDDNNDDNDDNNDDDNDNKWQNGYDKTEVWEDK